jgi:copper chaperone
MSPNDERTYSVTGMTCDHCVESVRKEVSEVAGVSDVEVDLGSGRLTVTGDGFTDEAIDAAVAEAGYAVAT